VVRWSIWLDAALAPRLRDPDALPPETVAALRLGSYEKLVRGTPPHAAVDAWVELAGRDHPRLRGLVNAVLRRVEAPHDPDPATEASLPEWLWRRFERALGDDAAAAARAMREPAPLWLWALSHEATASLRQDGSRVDTGPLPGTLRVRPSSRLGDLPAFRQGLVQPMNPASLFVARSVQPAPGERVLDLCSGRGVKAAVLASMGARVEAVEAYPGKLQQARRNLARLGLEAQQRVADVRDPPSDLAPATKVLLDAPCSGSGTLRGHPEIALRLAETDLPALTELQDRLLDGARKLVSLGGTLTYAVCSLTPDEGPERVAAFLARDPSFEPQPLDVPLPQRALDGGAFLLPHDGLDGFYLARMRRRG